MTLEQMEAIATNLGPRVADLEQQVNELQQKRSAASFGSTNNYYITNNPEGKPVVINENLTAFTTAENKLRNAKMEPAGNKRLMLDAIGEVPVGESKLIMINAFVLALKTEGAGNTGIKFKLMVDKKVIPFYTRAGELHKTEASLFENKGAIIEGVIFTGEEFKQLHAGLGVEEAAAEFLGAPIESPKLGGGWLAVFVEEGVHSVEFEAELVREEAGNKFEIRDHFLMVHV